MANAMNSFFVNIGSMVEAKIPNAAKTFDSYMGERKNFELDIGDATWNEVNGIIRKLNSGKSSGPFSIPIHILKEYSQTLVSPLTCIINKSLREGVFSALLKSALVCPIFKKGEKTKCENYRPISLLSNISKVFERVYYNKLEQFLNDNDIIYKLQFGFRKKYSTNHDLLSITDKIRSFLDNKTFACGVFVDLEKAFDTVNHRILLSKLEHYGIRGRTNSWLKSYLSNRDQCVKLNGCTSTKQAITCGVPQGSIIGPVLFIIYINDMNQALENCMTDHFADDTNLLYAHKDPKIIKKSCKPRSLSTFSMVM
jgi:hypothetical protein